jgi:hypothetical protein
LTYEWLRGVEGPTKRNLDLEQPRDREHAYLTAEVLEVQREEFVT